MDSSIIAAFSAILGTTVGGLTTFATTFLNQRYAMRRDILARDVANREQLYSEFLKEVGNLYFDSVNRSLHDTSQQASLIKMYSLVGRIRMISSEVVLTSAEKVADDIVESYKRPPVSFQEFQQSWEGHFGTVLFQTDSRGMNKQNSGHVVYISGIGGSVPALLAVLSKSTMPAVSKALALEYAANNIRFNTVSLGNINTPMHAKVNHAALAKFHPLGRMGEISDIVDAVLYLQNATFVTGENLRVDGGVHASR